MVESLPRPPAILGPLFVLHLVRLVGTEREIHVLTLSIHREIPDAALHSVGLSKDS